MTFESWPTITSTATPLRNPFITALDTNRSSRPPRSSPKIAMNAPTSSATMATAPSRWSAGTAAILLPTVTAMAAVTATVMNWELVVSAAVGVPTSSAYSPTIGLTPASRAFAIASGMLATPLVTPTIRSADERAALGLLGGALWLESVTRLSRQARADRRCVRRS